MSNTHPCEANAPAFTLPCEPSQNAPEYGLTKRELFAAMAMQGQLANSAILERYGLKPEDISAFAVKQADALIAELNK